MLVLAAGRGTRMGAAKALMTVDGVPWWRRQQAALRASGRRAIWVVSRSVREGMGELGDEVRLVDADDALPMFASVHAGAAALASAPPVRLHVLPVDVPLCRNSTLQALERAVGPCGVAVPRVGGRTGHPICLGWEWVRESILRLDVDHDVAAARLDLLTQRDRVLVDVDDDAVAVNLNTPADVKGWRSRSQVE